MDMPILFICYVDCMPVFFALAVLSFLAARFTEYNSEGIAL
ncbi:hypothetical protein Q671_16140 [Halomonas sp. PBN3]|nr:hypothetical protein Q671_16140 [Halomonas sp. PBN3]